MEFTLIKSLVSTLKNTGSSLLGTSVLNKAILVLHWPSIPPNWPTQLLLAGPGWRR